MWPSSVRPDDQPKMSIVTAKVLVAMAPESEEPACSRKKWLALLPQKIKSSTAEVCSKNELSRETICQYPQITNKLHKLEVTKSTPE